MPAELINSPLPWLLLTIVVWVASSKLSEALNNPLWASPMLTSILALVAILLVLDIDYATYFAGNQFLHFLLGPATVALAVPLYHSLPRLRENAKPLLVTLAIGSVVGATSGVALAWAFGLSTDTLLAFTTRAVSTPIAIGIADEIASPVALAAALVGISGLLGAMVAEPLLKRFESNVAKGFALGIAAHGIGTARAFQIHPTAGAFAALGMGLNGMVTAMWLPPVVHLLMS